MVGWLTAEYAMLPGSTPTRKSRGPDGRASGVADKALVHTTRTPLHLAFSCYLFDRGGQVLVTRRAAAKRTFAGVRTNSCCGHPAPGESMTDAIARRVQFELGITPTDVSLVLPAFRYRAEAADGTVENELCPVYRAVAEGSPRVNPAEVDDAWWVPWEQFVSAATSEADAADPLSAWAVGQVRELSALGPEPLSWPVADSSLLPAAALGAGLPGPTSGSPASG